MFPNMPWFTFWLCEDCGFQDADFTDEEVDDELQRREAAAEDEVLYGFEDEEEDEDEDTSW